MTDSANVVKKFSHKVNVEEGKKYFWCSCGLSQKQPFCDGAHKNNLNPDGTPQMRPIIFEAKEDGIVSFCGCKKSAHPVICDGAHRALKS
jgi:CDGSH-type Zn-finger protein